jgi:hypothetical protein
MAPSDYLGANVRNSNCACLNDTPPAVVVAISMGW